jgi:hypothetical protein
MVGRGKGYNGMYAAVINVPGHLPRADEPELFDTAAEAWTYLAEERERDTDDDLDETVEQLRELARGIHTAREGTGSVWARTPGYTGDHDLGLSYSVAAVDCSTERCDAMAVTVRGAEPVCLDCTGYGPARTAFV